MCEETLVSFSRVDLGRLRLATEVLLRLAEDGLLGDPLEAELTLFRDRVEHVLLLPDRELAATRGGCAGYGRMSLGN